MCTTTAAWLQADELTGRFATFGGVARFVLASVADAAAAKRAVDSAVLSMKAQDLLDAHGRLALDQDVSHKLMHYKVSQQTSTMAVASCTTQAENYLTIKSLAVSICMHTCEASADHPRRHPVHFCNGNLPAVVAWTPRDF